MKLLPSRRTFCVHHATMHELTVSCYSKPHTEGACVFSIYVIDLENAFCCALILSLYHNYSESYYSLSDLKFSWIFLFVYTMKCVVPKTTKSWKVDKQEKFFYLRCLLFWWWWWWFCFILLCFHICYLFVCSFVLLLLLFCFGLFSSRTMMNKQKLYAEKMHITWKRNTGPLFFTFLHYISKRI